MNLTKEEIVAIADRLDEVIGNHFHDAVYNVYLQREGLDLPGDEVYVADELSDDDVQRIKDELKRTL